MPKSRLEKAKEAFEKEQHKADLRRLKKAYEYFDMAMVQMKPLFNNSAHDQLAAEFKACIDEPLNRLGVIISKG